MNLQGIGSLLQSTQMKISIDVGRSADARTGDAHGSPHQRFVHFLVDDHALDVACLATATTAVINATVKLHFFDKLILMPLFVRCKSRHITFQKAYKKMNLLRQYLIVTCS